MDTAYKIQSLELDINYLIYESDYCRIDKEFISKLETAYKTLFELSPSKANRLNEEIKIEEKISIYKEKLPGKDNIVVKKR